VRRASRSWNIPLSSLCDHLNGWMHNNKMGLGGVLTNMEDVDVMAWVLAM
jgi:hypothetical protein